MYLDLNLVQYFQSVIQDGLSSEFQYSGTSELNLLLDFERMGAIPGAAFALRPRPATGKARTRPPGCSSRPIPTSPCPSRASTKNRS